MNPKTDAGFDSGQTPGIIGISLLRAILPLETGRTYQWYFILKSSAEAPLSIQGRIERVPLDPDFADELAIATPSEQAALYRATEIWYDAVTTLAQLRRAQPNEPNYSIAWTDLLRSLLN